MESKIAWSMAFQTYLGQALEIHDREGPADRHVIVCRLASIKEVWACENKIAPLGTVNWTVYTHRGGTITFRSAQHNSRINAYKALPGLVNNE